jgi:GT2 family glycosyltransferase
VAERGQPGDGRPTVSVIVPFLGSPAELDRLLADLGQLALRSGDEVIVSDNRPDGTRADGGIVKICAAPEIQAPGFARNCAARRARGDWLLFVDADATPLGSLIDDYFDPPPRPSAAVLAGSIRDTPARASLAARHSVARAQMSQQTTMQRERPYAQTANCAVRRLAFEQVGGFVDDARAGEDADLCFRLQAAGWELEQRPNAIVEHRSRESVPALLTQLARHGSGAAWVNRRFPGTFPPARPWQFIRRIGRSGLDAAAALIGGEPRAAGFALLDLGGALLPNRPRRERSAGRLPPERIG